MGGDSRGNGNRINVQMANEGCEIVAISLSANRKSLGLDMKYIFDFFP